MSEKINKDALNVGWPTQSSDVNRLLVIEVNRNRESSEDAINKVIAQFGSLDESSKQLFEVKREDSIHVEGQIGVSMIVSPKKTNDKVYLKIPSAPKPDEDVQLYCKNLYDRMQDEFKKFQIWNRIHKRLRIGGESKFTISRIIAFCVIPCLYRGVKIEVPALTYEYVKSVEGKGKSSEVIKLDEILTGATGGGGES